MILYILIRNIIILKPRKERKKVMLKTILFDLDGTLLPINTEKFIKMYFDELGIKFKEYFEKEEFAGLIWKATETMIGSKDPKKSNMEVFFEYFYNKSQHGKEIIDPLFEDFYIREFLKIEELTEGNIYIQKSIALLKDKGYELVIATNPLFPKVAVNHRIQWAGLDREDFILVTTFEDMHFCKPNINYYKEILEKINRNPKECMMVGNDVEEDMVAGELGFKTYLIEDHKIQRGENINNIDYVGKYQDFYKFVQNLPIIK